MRRSAGEVRLANGLRVIADYGLDSAPPIDVLVVTGGPGWSDGKPPPRDAGLSAATRVRHVDRVGLHRRDDPSGERTPRRQGSHHEERRSCRPKTSPLDFLRTRYPAIDVRTASLVDEGSIVTGGGVSLCIDTMLHMIARLFDAESADETARIIE